MRNVRVAVIGTGGAASGHLRDFSAKQGVEIVGISDTAEQSLRNTSATYPQAFAHTDVKTMLDKSKPDVVSVCTPNKFHCQYTLDSLNAGAHVVCEKPMAMNVKEAEIMEEARVRAEKLGLINFTYRNMASFRFARELIAKGELGNLTRVNVVYLQSFLGAPSRPYSWRNDISLAGFGSLGDLGVHMIDAVRFILQKEIKKVIGVAQTLIKNRPDHSGKMREITTDTNAAFLAQFENGMIGTFETSQIVPGYGNFFRIEISGEKGTLAVLSEQERTIWLKTGQTWQTCHPNFNVSSHFCALQPSKTPVVLIDILRGANCDYPTFQDGLRAQRVLDGILISVQKESWISI